MVWIGHLAGQDWDEHIGKVRIKIVGKTGWQGSKHGDKSKGGYVGSYSEL